MVSGLAHAVVTVWKYDQSFGFYYPFIYFFCMGQGNGFVGIAV